MGVTKKEKGKRMRISILLVIDGVETTLSERDYDEGFNKDSALAQAKVDAISVLNPMINKAEEERKHGQTA